MEKLRARLSLIASLVPNGARICDVGTDHARLPIALMESGQISAAIASDISKGPLLKAQENIARAGAYSIDLRLCDGLTGIRAGEADTVIIAGLGGEVIAGILSGCDWIRDVNITLILQPTTSAEALRRWLCENGFELDTEPALLENGKLYSVIRSRFTGLLFYPPPAFLYAGRVDPKTEYGALYIKKQAARCLRCADCLKDIPEKREEYRQYQAAGEELRLMIHNV